MKGKSSDLDLQRNDVLYVPENGMKKTRQTIEQAAITATAGIANLRTGLSLGQLLKRHFVSLSNS
jgi:hypothetical protein